MPRTRLLGLLIALLSPLNVLADRPQMVRSARSENGRFELRVRPGRPNGRDAQCRARLVDRRASSGEALRWETSFVNEAGPVHAFVRDDGRFVVTLDEFRRGGAAHAIVVYGEDGRRIGEFGLRDVLGADDWRHVRAEPPMLEWLREADFAFEPPASFAIRLEWGREIVVDLETARLAGARGRYAAPDGVDSPRHEGGNHEDTSAIPAELLALLEANDLQAETQAVVQRDRAFYEFLQRLVGAEIEESGVFPLEKFAAVVQAAERRAGEGGERRHDDAPTAIELDESAAAALAEDGDGVLAEAAIPDPASENLVTSIPPAPIPGGQTDYLAWLNEFTQTAGPGAQPLYEALAAAAPTEAPDKDLLDRALEGDPAALADPQIVSWLDANRAALAYYREIPYAEYNGWRLESENGMLLAALLPSLGPTRGVTRAAIVEGKRLEQEGRGGEAIDLYLDAISVGGQTGRGVTLIENLVGVAVEAQATNALLDSFSGPAGEQIDYAALAERLDQSFTPMRTMAQAIQFERASTLDVFQRLFEPDEDGAARVSHRGLREFLPFLGEDSGPVENVVTAMGLMRTGFESSISQVDRMYDDLTVAALTPFAESLPTFSRIAESVRSEVAPTNPLLGQLTPSLARARAGVTRGESQRRATALVTRIKAYEQQHGEAPASLEVFGDAAFATDPFTNARFRYERVEGGFRLYSPGADLADDGGTAGTGENATDLVYWPRNAE